MNISVLYEDNHLLVVVKPCNMPTQADQSFDIDLLTHLKEELKYKYNKPGNVYLGLVHRLDRPAGGVMVFAKTSKAASRLSDMIRNHQWSKIYIAVVHCTLAAPTGRLTHRLSKEMVNKQIVVYPPEPSHSQHISNSQEAWLDYEVLATSTDQALSFVRIHLGTGRKHQIRVQFAAIGQPLWGDQRYGQHINRSGQQLTLWSSEIAFEHPTCGDRMQFHAHPPNQFPWTLWSSR